jgi:hypothetical protein
MIMRRMKLSMLRAFTWFFRNCFFRLYDWGRRIPFNMNPDVGSALLIAITLILNIINIFAVIELFSGISLYGFVPKSNIVRLLLILAFGELIRHWLASKKRLPGTISEFSGESNQTRRKGKILALAYLLGSWLSFFFFLYLLARSKGGVHF